MRTTRIFLIVVLIMLAIPLLCAGLWVEMGRFLVVSDRLKPADAIVILSGGDAARIEEGASLFQKGFGQKMILTRTESDPDDPNSSAVFRLRDRAVELGVPNDAIIITKREVDITSDEAKMARRTLEYEKLKSCIVVTEPYHTRRTSLIFQNVFRGSNIKVYIHAVPEHWYKAGRWWLDERSREVTLSEYTKMIGGLFGY